MWRRTLFLLLTCLGLLWAGMGAARADTAWPTAPERASVVHEDALTAPHATPLDAAPIDAVDPVGDPSPSAELAEALLMAPPATTPHHATAAWLAHSDPRAPSALASHLLRPPSA